MEIPDPGFILKLPGKVPQLGESTAGSIGPINLAMKSTGARIAEKPHAAFDMAGAGNVEWSELCDAYNGKRTSGCAGKQNQTQTGVPVLDPTYEGGKGKSALYSPVALIL